ncbi:unnamed protein product [Leptosia nina]|uniref:Lipase n=1 Tax=Leptosia nina TaxID=320188 RepID=A0AAV1JD28_9NEOP
MNFVKKNPINTNVTSTDVSVDTEDNYLNITELIKKNNYTSEEYTVITNDGYRLKMFRIPGHGPVVFVMHGLLCSADDLVTPGVNAGIAFLLAQKGYDVWMGNARGTKHSRSNIYTSPSEKQFWDFSFHEIGFIDLPTMIDFVLEKTQRKTLTYIGHSQGTTAFYVMCSLLPEYNEKINLMISLSSVAWMSNIISPIRYGVPIFEEVHELFKILDIHEIFPDSPLVKLYQKAFCKHNLGAFIFCQQFASVMGGSNIEQTNFEHLSVIYNHFPAGSSVKQYVHYAQLVRSGYFRQYDYKLLNLQKYGTHAPPSYPVEKITAPIAIFYGKGDLLSELVDVKKLTSKLPNFIELYTVEDTNFSHFDFIYARDIGTLVFPKILSLLGKFSK